MTRPRTANSRLIQFLLVEDSPGDVRLAREALRDTEQSIRLHVVADGVEAMEFLRREGEHQAAPRPDLILLDLNLPRLDGREVLALVKGDADLKTIPTIVFTTSEAESDIRKCYDLNVNAYLSKPFDLDGFELLINSIKDFWLTQVWLPPGRET